MGVQIDDEAVETAAAAAGRGEPQCIVQRSSDGSFAYARDGQVFELGATLPGAVNRLDEAGIVATHWLPQRDHNPMQVIPSGVSRPRLSDEQRARLPRGW